MFGNECLCDITPKKAPPSNLEKNGKSTCRCKIHFFDKITCWWAHLLRYLWNKYVAAENFKKNKNALTDANRTFSGTNVRKRMPLWHYTEKASPVKSWQKRKSTYRRKMCIFDKITCWWTHLLRHLWNKRHLLRHLWTRKHTVQCKKHIFGKIYVRKRMPLWHYTAKASLVKSSTKRKTHLSAQNVHF